MEGDLYIGLLTYGQYPVKEILEILPYFFPGKQSPVRVRMSFQFLNINQTPYAASRAGAYGKFRGQNLVGLPMSCTQQEYLLFRESG